MDMPSPSIIRLYHLGKCSRKTDDKAITELVNDFDGDFAVDNIVEECELSSTSNSMKKTRHCIFKLKFKVGERRDTDVGNKFQTRKSMETKHCCSK
jgi:hypothetical protein